MIPSASLGRNEIQNSSIKKKNHKKKKKIPYAEFTSCHKMGKD